ncbi:hypothetical protein [Fulvivirga kasyanovii]
MIMKIIPNSSSGHTALAFILFLLVATQPLRAQTDTIFYDYYWSQTSREDALYFRLKPVKEENGYRIEDFYISGALQMSAFSCSDIEDMFDGEVVWYYESGEVMQKAEYKNGIKQGLEVQYDKQGCLLSEGVYKQNLPFQGVFLNRNNSYIEKSHYENGELVAWEIADFPEGSQAKVHMQRVKENDNSHFEAEYYDQNGEYIGRGIFNSKELKYKGWFVKYMFDPMNVLTTEHYTNGVIDTTRRYYRNGQPKSVKFDTGENTGMVISFDQKGQALDTLISKEGHPYEGGELVFLDGGRRFDDPLAFESYREGVLHGPYTLYYNNGQPWEQGQYINGEKDGETHFFYKDGTPCCSGIYKAGKKTDGKFHLKYSNGIELYEKGALKELRHFYPDGTLQQYSLADSLDIFYDTKGNELTRLTYKNQKPYQGKSLKFGLSDRKLSSRQHYEKGILTVTEYFSPEGKVSTMQRYKPDGNWQEQTEYYPSGEKMIHTQYGESSYDKVITYYDKEGNILGRLSDSRTKSGEEYDFKDGIIRKITHYEDDKVTYEKEYNRYGQLLYVIDHNGEACFYNQWGELTGQCTYINGKPYDGTFYTYKGGHVKSVGSMKEGQRHGKFIDYKWNSKTRHNDRTKEGNYIEGKEEGIFNEYVNGHLLRSVTFKNGKLEGEAIFYNGYGKELSRAQYQEDLPYEGTFYTYTNYQPYLRGYERYHNGARDGDEVFFDAKGNPEKIYTHKNGILMKAVIYKNNTTYELNYRKNIPYKGVKIEGKLLTYYETGYPVKKVAYRDYDHEQINFEVTYELPSDRSVKTRYFRNGMKKSVIPYDGNDRDGKASFYGPDGKLLGVGHYRKGTPVSGTLVYHHRHRQQDYLLVKLGRKSFKAYVFQNRKKELSGKVKLKSSFSAEIREEKLYKFLNMLASGYSNDFQMSSY